MIFERLRLIDDLIPGDGAWNMAVDEMLTQFAEVPTLRVYRWSEPTVTLGYFEKIGEVRRLRPSVPLMRRWTGGGLVDHGADWTYSLVIPATHELARGGRGESYCAIHRVIQQVALEMCGMSLELAKSVKTEGDGCFTRPVVGDLLWSGRKIAGAAQRRTRRALLHQGSIQGLPLENAVRRFADAFANQVEIVPLLEEEKVRAAHLVSTRYGLLEWSERF